MQTKKNNSEYEHFSRLSGEWWDENGRFKVLHQIRPIRIQYILNQLRNKNLKKLDILDVGCGGGLVSEPLSRLGANVIGVDFVENNIKVAKFHSNKKNLNIKYFHKNIEKTKLKQNFDVIILFEVLEHLEDWRLFLLKIIGNLKKDGVIIISTINRNLIAKYTAIYIAENIIKWIPKGTHSYDKFIRPDEILNCIKNKDFILKNLKGLVFNPINFEWQISNNTTVNYFCSLKKN